MRNLTKPISSESANARILAADLTLPQAAAMSDSDLLRHPTIGRRTLSHIRALATRSEQHTFTRDWLDSQAALLPLTHEASNSEFSDFGTETLSRLNTFAKAESARASLATRFALIILIPSILFSGITGALAIHMLNQSH